MPAISASTTRCSAAESASREHPPLLVFADDWGRHPSSCQHLVRHLLDRHEVYWVNTIGTRTPRLDLPTLFRGIEKIRHWTCPPRSPERSKSRLHIVDPEMWPWFRSRFDRALNRRLLLRHLGPLVRSLPVPPIAVTTIPIVADLIGALPVARWIYYCVDDLAAWPGLDGPSLRGMEKRLIGRADMLIAASEVLWSKLDREGRAVRLLTHGVDLDHWALGGETLPALENLEAPLIVFWGVIDRRLDSSFLERLTADLTRGTVVLVGPVSDPDPALTRLDRLVCLPPLPYERLPQLARRAAVFIMPYADLPVTQAMQPLKLKEYLAAGRPAVVRDLPATRPWADCLDLADTPGSFSEAVRSRIDSGLTRDQAAARSRLAGESWSRKARTFARWIMDVETPPDVARIA